MAIDPNDVARFKNALAKISLKDIRRRLDGNLIFRPWKRDLAEAEAGRRERETLATEERSHLDTANEGLERKDTSRRVWVLLGVAIVAAVALIWVLLPD